LFVSGGGGVGVFFSFSFEYTLQLLDGWGFSGGSSSLTYDIGGLGVMVMLLSWNTSQGLPQFCHSTGCNAAVKAAGALGLSSMVTVTRSGLAATMLEETETAREHAWMSFMSRMYRRDSEVRRRMVGYDETRERRKGCCWQGLYVRQEAGHVLYRAASAEKSLAIGPNDSSVVGMWQQSLGSCMLWHWLFVVSTCVRSICKRSFV
jgi:hypothetical protein